MAEERNWYDRIEEAVPLFFFFGILVLMTSGVILRYVFSFTFPWNVELARYAFVWLTFLGAAYVRRHHAHIKIEIAYAVLERRMSPLLRRIIWLFKEIAIVSFLILLIILGAELAWRSRAFRSQAMQLSQFFLYIAPSIGGAMFLFREIAGAIRQWKEGFDEPTARINFDS